MTHDELLKLNKSDLVGMVESLTAQVEDLQRQITAQDAALSASGEGGWLVTTRNPTYAGVTAGVEFKGGRAFVGDSRTFGTREEPVDPKEPGGEKKKVPITAEERVRELCADFGYKAQRIVAKDFQALGAGPAPEKPPFADIIRPAVMGGG